MFFPSSLSLDSVCAYHNAFECSILCIKLQLSKGIASDCHFTKFNHAVTVFGFLLSHLYEAKTTENQIQMNYSLKKIEINIYK